jgi:hypothetical protein
MNAGVCLCRWISVPGYACFLPGNTTITMTITIMAFNGRERLQMKSMMHSSVMYVRVVYVLLIVEGDNGFVLFLFVCLLLSSGHQGPCLGSQSCHCGKIQKPEAQGSRGGTGSLHQPMPGETGS